MNETTEILKNAKTIAVVGLSERQMRPAYAVSEYMQSAGYKIIPVHPQSKQVLGEKVYPDLDSVPEPIDIVNIFRRSDSVPPIVQAAIRKGAKVVWMQEGIEHAEAAKTAEAAGLKVVMDRCILKEHMRMRRSGG